MKHIILHTIVLLSILTVVSCSDFPSENNSEEEAIKAVNLKFENKVELTNFKKNNAVEMDGALFGKGELYRVEFDGKLKYNEDAFIRKGEYDNNPKFYRFEKPSNIFSNFMSDEKFEKEHVIKIPKNEIKDIKGSIFYEKKEKGWEIMKTEDGKTEIELKFY